MDERWGKIALAGLLHDIGKFGQRAGEETAKGKNHPAVGEKFVQQYVPALWRDALAPVEWHHGDPERKGKRRSLCRWSWSRTASLRASGRPTKRRRTKRRHKSPARCSALSAVWPGKPPAPGFPSPLLNSVVIVFSPRVRAGSRGAFACLCGSLGALSGGSGRPPKAPRKRASPGELPP